MQGLMRLDRPTLYAHAERYFRHGGSTEPNVVVVNVDGLQAVFKDYAAASGWFAWLLGPILIRREIQALERLAGVAGVPALYRRVDRRGLLMEYVPAVPWPQVKPPAPAYEQLAALVASMHARGVAHCDLRAPSNILADSQGQPYLVDFVARVLRGGRWNLPWNWIFERFCEADRNALAKLKVRQAPELATADEQLQARHHSGLHRFARGIGMAVRRFIRLFVPGHDR